MFLLQISQAASFIAFILLVVASVRFWLSKKSGSRFAMVVGSVTQVLGVLSIEVAPFVKRTSRLVEDGSGSLAIGLNVFDIDGRFLVPFGLLVFSAGFVVAAFTKKNETIA